MKKILSLLFFVVLALVVVLVLAKDLVIKTSIEQAVTRLTGFKTKVEGLKYDFPSTIHIKGLELKNPAGFEEKIFTSIPEIYISLVLPEILQGKKTHLTEVRLNVQEVHIEKNEEGVSNVELLSSVGGKSGQKAGAKPKEEKAEKKPPMPFQLDRLELTVRNVSYEDRSGVAGLAPVPGKKIAVDLNLQKEVFTDITDPVVLVNVVLSKILTSATFGKLLNINPSDLLGDNLSGVVSSGQAMVGQQAAVLQDQVGGIAGQATTAVTQLDVTKKTGDLTGGAVDQATAGVSGLLGKVKALVPAEDTTAKDSQ